MGRGVMTDMECDEINVVYMIGFALLRKIYFQPLSYFLD